MLLGQLYYYEKELTKLGSNLVVQDFLNIEIAGVNKSHLAEIEGYDSIDEFGIKLKELFIQNYLKLLQENQLFQALNFWKLLTSAVKEDNVTVAPKSEFQAQLLDWVYTDGEIKNIQSKVLNLGRYSDNQEDFALYYGLNVLYQIYQSQNDSSYSNQSLDLEIVDNSSNLEYNQNPEMILITSNAIKPLISNLNCIFVPNDEPKEIVSNLVTTSLNQYSDIKLIIIDSQEPELIQAVKKANITNALLVELNFSSNQEDNFFDVLVKQTLGINLG